MQSSCNVVMLRLSSSHLTRNSFPCHSLYLAFSKNYLSWDFFNRFPALAAVTTFPNLLPRFSLLPVERPWLGLDTCLPEAGRIQTNVGRISVRFVSTKRRRQGQWKLCILACHVFYSSRTSQDKTSNAESFDSESVTSGRISGYSLDVAKEIADSPLVQSKIF